VQRKQLRDTGPAMFAEKPYDDVLYHYYESKRDFYVAMFFCQLRFLARPAEGPCTAARRVTCFRHERVSISDGVDRHPGERPLR